MRMCKLNSYPPAGYADSVCKCHAGCAIGPVKVSYFDPATGEPAGSPARPTSPSPARKQEHKQKKRVYKLKPGRPPAPVEVDGVRYESFRLAALALGVSLTGLRNAARRHAEGGNGTCKGHAVRALACDAAL